jgi:hypothetical protein
VSSSVSRAKRQPGGVRSAQTLGALPLTTFFFSIEACPTSASANASDIAGASVLVFVIADSLQQGEDMARSAILGYGWVVKEVSISLQPNHEQIARLDAQMSELHQQALLHRLAFFFVAHPSVEGKPDDPVQIRSLGFPVIDESIKH